MAVLAEQRPPGSPPLPGDHVRSLIRAVAARLIELGGVHGAVTARAIEADGHGRFALVAATEPPRREPGVPPYGEPPFGDRAPTPAAADLVALAWLALAQAGKLPTLDELRDAILGGRTIEAAGLPADVARVIEGLLDPVAAKRPASAEAVLAMLAPEGVAVPAARPTTPPVLPPGVTDPASCLRNTEFLPLGTELAGFKITAWAHSGRLVAEDGARGGAPVHLRLHPTGYHFLHADLDAWKADRAAVARIPGGPHLARLFEAGVVRLPPNPPGVYGPESLAWEAHEPVEGAAEDLWGRPARALAKAADLCRGLVEGHAAGRVHGGLHLNFRGAEGRWRLEASPWPAPENRYPHPPRLLFLSPEHLRGEPTTPRSDLFSLGCVLQADLGPTGFEGIRIFDSILMQRISSHPIRWTAPVAEPLRRLVERLAAPDAAARPASAAAALAEIDACRG